MIAAAAAALIAAAAAALIAVASAKATPLVGTMRSGAPRLGRASRAVSTRSRLTPSTRVDTARPWTPQLQPAATALAATAVSATRRSTASVAVVSVAVVSVAVVSVRALLTLTDPLVGGLSLVGALSQR